MAKHERKEKTKTAKIITALLVAVSLVTLGPALIGFGLALGIIIAWVGRGLGKT